MKDDVQEGLSQCAYIPHSRPEEDEEGKRELYLISQPQLM